MDKQDQEIVALLEDQNMVNKKFADRVAKRFEEIGTTPNWLTMWRIILSIPMFLCFIVANLFLNKEHDFTPWLWGTFGTSVFYAIHELRNFYYKKNTVLLTRARILFFLPLLFCTFLSISSLRFETLIWLLCMTAGALFYAWAGLLDFFDGALARYQDDVDGIPKETRPRTHDDTEYNLPFSERLKLRGSSHYGTVLDPFSDKQWYFFAILPLSWFIVDHVFLWASLLVALFLTFLRFRAIRRALEFGGKGAANRFGKYKIWVEVFAVAAAALLPGGEHAAFKEMVVSIFIGTALAFGCLSLSGHAWLGVKKAKMAALQKLAASKRRRSSSSNLPVSK
jgi:phosphatidylglycerophosphate synthase